MKERRLYSSEILFCLSGNRKTVAVVRDRDFPWREGFAVKIAVELLCIRNRSIYTIYILCGNLLFIVHSLLARHPCCRIQMYGSKYSVHPVICVYLNYVDVANTEHFSPAFAGKLSRNERSGAMSQR